MAYELMIQNGGNCYFPILQSGVVWETERKGVPGKLSFTVIKDDILNFQEGNAVVFRKDNINLFYGFIFTKKRNKDGTIQVTAYDQLRYLKNKDTIQYENKKASEVIQMLANDFHLQCGDIADTGHVMESVTEEDTSLFDVIQAALDETLRATGKLYVLYDDFGKLTLQNIEALKTDFLIDDMTGEDFDYQSSIDEQTYNKIQLSYDNEDTGKRERFTAQDGENINSWGVLQYYEALQSNTGAAAKANALLKLYNQKTRKLTIKNVLGDVRIRAGTAIVVNLNLGDIIAKNYMMVEKAKHTLTDEAEHFMDLTLIGGEFIA